MADVEENSPFVEAPDDEIEEDIPVRVPIPLHISAITYSVLLTMAILPIWIGSKRALTARKKRIQDIKDGKTGDDLDEIEVISSNEAARFPIMASITLFTIYLLYKYFADKMYYFVTGYFFLLGVAAVTAVFEPLIAPRLKFIFPGLFEDAQYQLYFSENQKKQFDFNFSRRSLIVLAAATACAGCYLFNQHWIANNIIGLCFSVQAIEMMSLPNYKTGCMLLSGLFFYDVFWVFGTDVMVTVAKKFDAPVKLVFPSNIFDDPGKLSMLGLGDIVIPGILVALMLRFDEQRQSGSQKYFMGTFIAYIIGLFGTIVVMLVFEHAQPALLYLVPACLGTPFLIGLFSGELQTLFDYTEEEDDEEETATKKNE